jgi:hypothetical protein
MGFCLPVLMLVGTAAAQDAGSGRNTFYFGMGANDSTNPLEDHAAPFSLGFMHKPANKVLLVGFDLAGEGTKLDSTFNKTNDPTQSISLNLIVGANVVDNGHFRANAALLIGIRESATYCDADSFLGLECYAGADPYTDYKANFGGVITVSFDQWTLGLRATGESAQIIAGISF